MASAAPKPLESSRPAVGFYHIRGYVRHVRIDHVVATVIATLAGQEMMGMDETLERTCGSHDAAFAAIRELTVEMGNRIRARGDTVVDVQMFES